MRLVMRAEFDPNEHNDEVMLAIALADLVDLHVWPLTIKPGLPGMFTRLLEKDPSGPKDAMLVIGAGDVGHTDLRVTRLSICPYGVDPDQWPIIERDVRRQITFLYAGTVPPPVLMDAWFRAKNEIPTFDAKCKVTAFGSVRDRLRLYEDADVLVLATFQPRRMLEAMSTGLPVIGSDRSDTGWVGSMGEAIVDAWRYRLETARKGRLAAGVVRAHMTWRHVAERVVKQIVQTL